MTTPVDDRPEPQYAAPSYTAPPNTRTTTDERIQRPEDDEKTWIEDNDSNGTTATNHTNTNAAAERPNMEKQDSNRLGLSTGDVPIGRMDSIRSPSQAREQVTRLEDDLAMLQVERAIHSEDMERASMGRSLRKERSHGHGNEPIDEFDVATNPLHTKAAIYKPPENPTSKVARFFKKVHESTWVVRYVTYIAPVTLIILIPLLLGALKFKDANVGGVELSWFCIWLEIVWLTLWAGRVSRLHTISLHIEC